MFCLFCGLGETLATILSLLRERRRKLEAGDLRTGDFRPPELPPNSEVKETLKTTGLPDRDESLDEMVTSGSEICRLFRFRLRNEPCLALVLLLLPADEAAFSLDGAFSSEELSLLSLLLPRIGLPLPQIQFHLLLRILLFRFGVMADDGEAEVAERPPLTTTLTLLSPLGLSHRPNGVRSLKSSEARLLGRSGGCEVGMFLLSSISMGLAVTLRIRGKGCGLGSGSEGGGGKCNAASGGTEPDLNSRLPTAVKSRLVLRFRLTGGLICSDFSKVLALLLMRPMPTGGWRQTVTVGSAIFNENSLIYCLSIGRKKCAAI